MEEIHKRAITNSTFAFESEREFNSSPDARLTLLRKFFYYYDVIHGTSKESEFARAAVSRSMYEFWDKRNVGSSGIVKKLMYAYANTSTKLPGNVLIFDDFILSTDQQNIVVQYVLGMIKKSPVQPEMQGYIPSKNVRY